MYYIAVYDVASPKRLPKMLRLMRKYLNHVQNSVFEGELTPAQFEELKYAALSLMNEEEDSLIMYTVGAQKWLGRETLGIEKNSSSNFV